MENSRETIYEHFRAAIRRRRSDLFLADRFFTGPLSAAARWCAASLARLHHGRLSAYVAYAAGALILALAIATTQ